MHADNGSNRGGDGQDQSPSRKPRIGGGPLVAVVLILLPILYVLSEGPVAGLVARGYLPQGFDLSRNAIEVKLNWRIG